MAESPPRKTNPFKNFSGMASQNDRYNTKDDELFWLENIMRTGPRKLTSVPGPGPAFEPFGTPEPVYPPPHNLVAQECVEFDGSDQEFTQQNNCGFFINLCVPANYVGVDSLNNAYTQATYKDSPIGTATSGPAMSIAAGSTRADFTGYAAIYNSTANIVTLGKWINQSLDTIPTALGSVSTTLNNNDVVRISKNQTTNIITVKINGGTVISVMDLTVSFSNPGFGIVGVGTDTGSQNWAGFTVSCAEYAATTPEVGACCVGAPAGLSIQCCSSVCDFPCDRTVEFVPVELRACGGTPPYTWNTNDNNLVLMNNPANTNTRLVGFLRDNFFSSESFGFAILPYDVFCTTGEQLPPPPPPGQIAFATHTGYAYGANFVGPSIIQFTFDCAGNFIDWSGVTLGSSGEPQDAPDRRTVFRAQGSGNVTQLHSYFMTLHHPDCPFGDSSPIGFGSANSVDFSVDGSPQKNVVFDRKSFCLGRQDPGCYSPTLEYVPWPVCQCYDSFFPVGIVGAGQYVWQWYEVTPRTAAAGADGFIITVTDSASGSASVVIDLA